MRRSRFSVSDSATHETERGALGVAAERVGALDPAQGDAVHTQVPDHVVDELERAALEVRGAVDGGDELGGKVERDRRRLGEAQGVVGPVLEDVAREDLDHRGGGLEGGLGAGVEQQGHHAREGERARLGGWPGDDGHREHVALGARAVVHERVALEPEDGELARARGAAGGGDDVGLGLQARAARAGGVKQRVGRHRHLARFVHHVGREGPDQGGPGLDGRVVALARQEPVHRLAGAAHLR